MYYSSGSKKCPSSASVSSDVLIPGTHEKAKKLSSLHSASVSSDWKDIPSPLTNAQGLELDNCDALLAELGLSPMPQQIGKSTRVSPRRASPNKKRRSSPRKKTPVKSRKGASVQPSPLRNQVDMETTKSGRNSFYKKLFQMKPKKVVEESANKVETNKPLVQQANQIQQKTKPTTQSKTSTVSAKLRVGADLLPAKSVKPLTVPREFSFATDQRLKRSNSTARLGTSMSSASIAEKKTLPTNMVVSRQVRPPTQPMSPKFSKRMHMVRQEKISQPLNAAVQKPVAPTRTSKVTVPKSPNFSTARPRKSHINPLAISAQTSFLSTPFKARPAPKFGKPFEPVRPHKHTVPRDMKLPGDHANQSKRLKLESDRNEAEVALSQLALHTPARKTHAAGMNPSTPIMAPKPHENQENQPRNNLLLAAKKVTIPRSPKFSTSTRIRQRNLSNQP